MDLFLLRHGLAGERDEIRYPDDSLRPLTAEGRRKMRRIAAGMRALDLEFDAIWSSPYLRARQTAEIVADAFRARNRMGLVPELAPDGGARRLLRRLRGKHPPGSQILLVGHEPYLGELAGLLISGRAGLPLALKKGGLCLLSLETPARGRGAALEWLLTPRQLLALGR